MARYFSNAWLLLGLALLAWAGVGYFAWYVAAAEAQEQITIQNLSVSFAENATVTRLRVLARETVDERRRLDAILAADVVSVADMIESIGEASGTSVKLINAMPDSSRVPANMHATNLSVEGSGTFGTLMRAAQLLEMLPVASHLTSLDLERVPSATGPQGWHLTASLRVLSSATTTP